MGNSQSGLWPHWVVFWFSPMTPPFFLIFCSILFFVFSFADLDWHGGQTSNLNNINILCELSLSKFWVLALNFGWLFSSFVPSLNNFYTREHFPLGKKITVCGYFYFCFKPFVVEWWIFYACIEKRMMKNDEHTFWKICAYLVHIQYVVLGGLNFSPFCFVASF